VHIHPIQLHVMQNMMASTHSVLEQVRRGDPEQDLHILATNVYIKTPQGWRIAVHHASVAPGRAPIDVRGPTTLH
jgi:ketosteroid isomerase-like protein